MLSRLGAEIGPLAGAAALAVLLSACSVLGEGEPPIQTPVVTESESSRPVFEARRGTITQTVKLVGRVSASEEAELYFKQSGRLSKLYVEPNQSVKMGDVLAELETANLRTQIEQAKLNLEIAEIQLDRTTDRVGSEAGVVADTKAAEAKASMEKAQADYLRAASEVERLRAGPASADLRALEQALLSAEASYSQAQIELEKVRAGATPETIRSAEFDLERARNSLWAAQISRNAACGSGGPACEAGNATVAAAQTSVDQAVDHLERLRAGPKPEEVAQAEKNVATAKASVDSARVKLEQAKSGVRPSELAAAEQSLAAYRAALDAAKANLELAKAAAARSNDYDVRLQEKQVQLARVSLRALEEQLALSQIKAPFDGVVVFARGREGESVIAFTPVITLANPKVLQVAVEPSLVELAKIKPQQEATIVFGDFPSEPARGRVVALATPVAASGVLSTSGQRTVRLDFERPQGRTPQLGSLASVTIVTESRDNTVILPSSAIRTFGTRRFVRVMTPGGRREDVDVEVGVSTDAETEIVKGLQEGQKVVAP